MTLCNFSIPEELEFQYSRVNQLLLKILEPARQDESIQRIAVHLCNALVCQVDNHHKEAVGKMGFVKVTSKFSFPPVLFNISCCEVSQEVLLFPDNVELDTEEVAGSIGELQCHVDPEISKCSLKTSSV